MHCIPYCSNKCLVLRLYHDHYSQFTFLIESLMLFIPKTKAKWNRVCLLPKRIHTWMWTWSSQGAHLRFGCSFRISVGAILDLAESYHPPAVLCWFASCHLSALLQSQLFKHSSHLLLKFYEAPHFFFLRSCVGPYTVHYKLP